MALAITILSVDAAADNIYVYGTLAAAGNYATGGDTIDFTTVSSQIAASRAPVQLWVGGSTGDSYSWVKGTALNNQKVKLNSASNTELGAGAYPARITGDTGIQFEAVFSKML
jgi:hypothetical protein